MIRGTRRTQTRRIAAPRKRSSARRRPGPRKASIQEDTRHPAMAAKTGAAGRTARQSAGVGYEAALKNFETALRHFQKKDYEKAGGLFAKVAAGPIREIADRARVHLRFCETKRRHESRPKTAEGYYARGVAALNAHDFDRAVQFLSKSDEMIPNQEYVHYALAAAYGLQGDSDNAISHLGKSINLRPQNRVQARHDEDFQVLAGDSRFTRLLGIDGR